MKRKNKETRMGVKVVRHVSSGGVVLTREGNVVFVALLKNRWGEWVLSKGHIEDNENSRAAAIREVREELGIKTHLYHQKKIGIDKYSFKLPHDKRKHYKIVHIYLFMAKKRASLEPQLGEGITDAKWFAIKNALKKVAHESDRGFIKKAALILTGADKVVDTITKRLNGNLSAIIGSGSNFNDDPINRNWSDIDLLFVFKKIDLEVKQKVALLISYLENKHRMHFGIVIVSEQEVTDPVHPELVQAGKVLQSLRDLSLYPERLLYCCGDKVKFYVPTKSAIRTYSISNIGMFLLRNRRTLIRVKLVGENLTNALKEQIRASFIITRLSVQAKTLNNPQSKKDILIAARKAFRGFNFDILNRNLLAIKTWQALSNKEKISLLKKNDNFIESFSRYALTKIEKK